MTQQARILFDECLSVRAVKSLIEVTSLSGFGAELAHLLDRFPQGTLDADWIPRVAPEGWIVVTADRGKHRPARGMLPKLCAEFGVTHVMFSSGLHKRRAFFKMTALQQNFEAICGLTNAPRGSGHSLYLASHDSVKLKQLTLPPDAPRTQQTFLP